MNHEYHKSVLVQEALDGLEAVTARIIVDATCGDGGYSSELLRVMPPDGMVIAIDRDPQAIARAKDRLSSYQDRFVAVKGNFCNIDTLVTGLGITQVDGVVADLGVSYLQISDPERGFMFMKPGPLLMNMGDDCRVNAETVVNEYSGEELARIFWEYGEERASWKIANAITRFRQTTRITTTRQLVDIIRGVVGSRFEIKSFARIFQAIRMHVNMEIENLKQFLPASLRILKTGGVLAIVAYHSGEDRIVKEFMREQANPCTCPKELPWCVCGKKPVLQLKGKMITPGDEEIRNNPSARSAKLRVAQVIGKGGAV
ncbi:MAG TPA: 16S rRNA (cytosine(1402)-N(4))-methyltransferase RsmH [bacterium]|nr:16S rRNA (cytosine(1402)-N(4))-methyltransferase RsmH [bacterium]HPN41860.1 16S rRNA (cytosine(1402)-N(4))-methyltransferase RsmH [bacterium]